MHTKSCSCFPKTLSACCIVLTIYVVVFAIIVLFSHLYTYRTSPDQQRQAGQPGQPGQPEVVPSTPPPPSEEEREALPEISPTELRATGKQPPCCACTVWRAWGLSGKDRYYNVYALP